jgi:hypothetical protein
MNKFWSQLEEDSPPKIARDDEQLLALNYENLCDPDYLNRLFQAEASHDSQEIFRSPWENDDHDVDEEFLKRWLLSPEFPEDIIVFGHRLNRNLGLQFAKIRSLHDSCTLPRSVDNCAMIAAKQILIFHQISKLLIDRKQNFPVAPSIPPNFLLDDLASKSTSTHIVPDTLSCIFDTFESYSNCNLTQASLLPLLSLIPKLFQRDSDSAGKESKGNVRNKNRIDSKHLMQLKSILSKVVLNALSKKQTLKENIKQIQVFLILNIDNYMYILLFRN